MLMPLIEQATEIYNPRTILSSRPAAEVINQLVGNAITWALVIGGAIFLITLLSGAVTWITSGGDKASLEAAKSRVTHSLIGLAILFGVFTIATIIGQMFGVGPLQINSPAPTPQSTPPSGMITCSQACLAEHGIANGSCEASVAGGQIAAMSGNPWCSSTTPNPFCICDNSSGPVTTTLTLNEQPGNITLTGAAGSTDVLQIQWDSTNATSCTLTTNPANLLGVQNVDTMGATTATVTFPLSGVGVVAINISCTGPGGTATDSKTATLVVTAGTVVLQNNATGTSCATVCGARTCLSVGNNAAANNGAHRTWYPDGGGICADEGADCSTPMGNSSQTCEGRTASWTNCLCQQLE